MNALDLVLAVLLLAPAAAGFWRGFLQPAGALAGMVAGALLGIFYARPLSRSLFDWGGEQGWADLIVFASLFLGSVLLCALAARLVDHLMREAGVKFLDRLGGMAAGAVIGLLIGAVLVFAAAALLPDESRTVEESLLAPHVVRLARDGAELLPDDLKERFQERYERLKGEVRDAATTASPQGP